METWSRMIAPGSMRALTPLGVEQGHGGVAAVVLDLVVIDGVGVVLKDSGQLAPVTKDDLALAAAEYMRALPVDPLTGLFANI